MVGERSNIDEGVQKGATGEVRSENAGVSNEKTGENPVRRKPKVSRGRVVLPG